MKTKKVLLIALVLALALFGAVGCTKKTDATSNGDSNTNASGPLAGKTLVVATDAPYPPMEMVKSDGSFEGFDIDILTAAAKEAGAKVEFKTSGFDALIAAMGATGGDFDCAISSITITDERKQNMLFSDPYFNANQSLAVPSDSTITSTDQLKSGDMVAVQLGTTGEIWAKENLAPKGIVVKPYDQIPGCFDAMLAGDVIAVIADFQVTSDYAKDATRKAKIVQQIDTGEQYGIAFPKGSEETVKAINEGLKTIKDNGSYAKYYKTWFGVEPETIP